MRKGRMTFSPVSGCSVESTIFLACHSSGVMDRMAPVLYCMMSCLACSRPEEEVRRVLHETVSRHSILLYQRFSEVKKVYKTDQVEQSYNHSGTHHLFPSSSYFPHARRSLCCARLFLTSDQIYLQNVARDPSTLRGHTAMLAAHASLEVRQTSCLWTFSQHKDCECPEMKIARSMAVLISRELAVKLCGDEVRSHA